MKRNKEKVESLFCHLRDVKGTFIQISFDAKSKDKSLSLLKYNLTFKQLVKIVFNCLFKKQPLSLTCDINRELQRSIIEGLTKPHSSV